MRVRSLRDQAMLFVVFFCVLVISILALYLYGVPTTMEIEENKWTIFADACAYFFPCLAALIGGWGIFLGTGAKTERPRERSWIHRAEKKLYFASMILLYVGVLGYVTARPCRWPACILALDFEIISCFVILHAGHRRKLSRKQKGFWPHFRWTALVAMVVIAIAFGAIGFFWPNILFQNGNCAV